MALSTAFSLFRWAPSALSGQPRAVALAQRLLRQGLQLGLVGLLTGLAGSAAAHQITQRRRQPVAQGSLRQLANDAIGSLGGAGGCRGAGGQQPQKQRLQRWPTDVLLPNALQRGLFMAIGANARHALLYAAEDRLGVYTGGPAAVWATRAGLHGANSLLAAAQWRHMSQSIYSDASCR